MLNRKDRKEHKEKLRHAPEGSAIRRIRSRKFPDLKLVGAEVDQDAMFKPCGFQVTQDLRFVLRGQCFGSLQLHDENSANQQVGDVIPDQRSVLVENLDRVLLLDVQPGYPQAVRQSILINFLEMTVSVKNMD